jgi:hypothetical protein
MRTKSLLLSAAALAAGLASSVAQSNVYSVNVVGYVNKALPAGVFHLVANPLDDGTNTLNSALAALAPKSQAQFWNGASFDNYTKGGTWPVAPGIAPGVGFFVKAQLAVTNTFVGSVAAPVGGSVTSALPAGVFVLVSSKIPYAGDLNDTNLALIQLAAKSQVQKWNLGTLSFDNYTKGGTWPANPGVQVAEGFFVKSQTATNWVQNLPAN